MRGHSRIARGPFLSGIRRPLSAESGNTSGAPGRTRKPNGINDRHGVVRNYWGARKASTASIGTRPQRLSFSFPATM